ncbi:hypothetical protein BDDG_04842 [Blastomyces dermatitidis ATCC 18188]|uniref:PD-(D/E)XK nuclease-like domain-containing protein n=1 Tax=Ajellomyces dermatitidis (strain ATCC 18188 / CBS 674.68) TaxID=653446 RepID=F2TF86_AJEDA|nr:hypothetical protein BDDG_04842 [Blastomyces dermatitidis ATCC 18188]
MVQLGVWMVALCKRLEGTMKNPEKLEAPLKPMPCLKIEGLDWKAYWCFVGDKGETMLYGPQHLVSTMSMKGMYQIFMALRETAKYGRDDHWPWFRETILWEN